MKLSEAVRLGSLLVPEPQAGNVQACAITMAALATGFKMAEHPLHGDWYGYIAQRWPWTITAKAACPCGKLHLPARSNSDGLLHGSEVIWGPFDEHVAIASSHQMTIEQLADWIASIEPEETDEATVDANATHVDRDELLLCEQETALLLPE